MASAAVFSTWGIGVKGLARLGYTVLIGRAFGTETLGHASALMSLSIFVALLWPTAAGNTASRFVALALHRSESEAAVTKALGTSMLVSSVVLGVAAVPVARALGNGWTLSLLGAWLVVGYGLYAFARGAQLGYHRAGRVASWDTVSAAVALGALVAVVAGGQGALVLAPLALGYTVFAVACWPRSRAGSGDAAPAVREALRFAAWNVLAGLTTNGLLQLAMIAAQVVAPGREAGVYAAAFTLATPASMLGQAVSQIVIPAFAHRGEGASLRNRGPLLVFGVFSLVAAVVFGAMALLAPWYLPLFYPAEGADAVPVLRLLMLGVYVFTVALIPAALLLATGRSRSVALVSVAGFAAGVVTIVATASSAGVQAGSVGFLVGSTINLVAVLWLALRAPRPGPDAPSTVQSGTAPDVAV